MKKVILTTMVLLFTSFAFIACSNDDDDVIIQDFSTIPESAQQFVKNHFSGVNETFDETTIRQMKREKNGEYEIIFTNGIEIDFYANGVWKEIDTNGNILPNSIAMLIPERALNYISSKYPSTMIEDIEKQGLYSETQGFKIELRNDVDIYFDYQGNVLNDNGQTSGNSNQAVQPSELPASIQAFLETYFAGQTPNKVKKEWNEYEITFNNDTNNEIDLEFTAAGEFQSVSVENNNPIIREIIGGVSKSESILTYLDQNHSGQRIEEFSRASSLVGAELQGGYVVETETSNGIDYKIYFKSTGEHYRTIID